MRRLFLKVSLTVAFATFVLAAAAAAQETHEGAHPEYTHGNFHLIEGLTVRRVEFGGMENTPDNVVRRKLLFQEGDTFTVEDLGKSIAAFNRLGRFEKVTEDVVSWYAHKETGEVDLIFEFTDKRTAREKREAERRKKK
ncbi:MAG TPA: POTRA domain-containing protein [Pyrinomonadaceae bacterium]|nr:POTRA domain-containing protein [Pyrinomonadaceae bacterium]